MNMNIHKEKECTVCGKDCGDYKLCLYHNEQCGEYRRTHPAITGVFEIDDLSGSTKQHFASMKLLDSEGFTEKTLIENRSGTVMRNGKVCAYHRYTLGVGYKSKTSCMHPEHDSKRKMSTSTVSVKLAMYTSRRYGFFPVGGIMCTTHKLKTSNEMQASAETSVPESDGHDDQHEHEDVEYVPEEINVSEEVLEEITNKSSQLTSCLEASPLVTLKRKRIEDLGKKSKDKYKNKYKKLVKSLKDQFAEVSAPGQEKEFLYFLEDSDDSDDNGDGVPTELRNLQLKYEQSDSMGKLTILSLIDHDKYSHQLIKSVFACSEHILKKSIIMSKQPAFQIPTKTTFKRNKLNVAKCEHFIDYMFANGFIQDTAFGSRKLKFDSGEVQEIPRAILTCKFSHLIGSYLDACERTDFEPVSPSTLWRILRNIKPSQQKSLAGLDDILATAMNGFDVLKKIAKELSPETDLLEKQLEKGKRYLKTQYPSHCTTSSTIKTHNINFALSDTINPKLVAPYDVNDDTCVDCIQLWKAVNKVNELALLSSAVNQYDAKIAIEDIKAYVCHLLRDVQQQKAKAYAFEQLDDPNSLFWLKDYCQKIIPAKFREGQVDYFGKKGMSLHVDVFFYKEYGILKKKVYFTAMTRSDQDAEDVLALADNLLQKVKNDFPHIKRIFSKSDNAGCYHNALGPEALHQLCAQYGITLVRYDFNEPCRGKDQCDRESAGGKTVLKSYLYSGKDVVSAEDIFQGMHHGYGMRNAEVCVAVNDKQKSSLQGKKVKNFSNYHSFEFRENGVQAWRYYGIGEGILLPYVNPSFTCKGFSVQKSFSKTETIKRTNVGKSKPRSDRMFRNLFFCDVEGCSQVFEKQIDYESHCLNGDHDMEKSDNSSMDQVRKKYVAMMKMSSPKGPMMVTDEGESPHNVSMNMACAEIPVMESFSKPGYALPVRAYFRYNTRQTEILYRLFIEGEKSGKKVTATQAVDEIRKLLPVDEFVKVKQVKSLFSRWSKKYRQGELNITDANAEEADEDEDDEDESAVNYNDAIRIQTNATLDEFEKDDDCILHEEHKGKYFCVYYPCSRYWSRLEKVLNDENDAVTQVEVKFLHYSCGFWDFPKSGEDVKPKVIDAQYVFLGPCTPAECKSNGYRFKEDEKAIQLYKKMKSKFA